jgi:pimeloyl-ACP methyl ester carboxylesterase
MVRNQPLASLATTAEAFVNALGLQRYALYVFDYGAPVGFRLAVAHPERVTAIIAQNGNTYEDGLSDAWDPIRRYWAEPTAANRTAVRDALLTFEGTHMASRTPRRSRRSPTPWTRRCWSARAYRRYSSISFLTTPQTWRSIRYSRNIFVKLSLVSLRGDVGTSPSRRTRT